MAITQGMCTSFKVEVLKGVHNFTAGTGDTFKLALYIADATVGPSSTVYTVTGEVTGTGYSAGGEALTAVTPTSSGTTAIADFDNLTFSTVTLEARGAMIYNSSQGNKAVCILDFGATKAVTAADFTITFPAADAANAIVRIGGE